MWLGNLLIHFSLVILISLIDLMAGSAAGGSKLRSSSPAWRSSGSPDPAISGEHSAHSPTAPLLHWDKKMSGETRSGCISREQRSAKRCLNTLYMHVNCVFWLCRIFCFSKPLTFHSLWTSLSSSNQNQTKQHKNRVTGQMCTIPH